MSDVADARAGLVHSCLINTAGRITRHLTRLQRAEDTHADFDQDLLVRIEQASGYLVRTPFFASGMTEHDAAFMLGDISQAEHLREHEAWTVAHRVYVDTMVWARKTTFWESLVAAARDSHSDTEAAVAHELLSKLAKTAESPMPA